MGLGRDVFANPPPSNITTNGRIHIVTQSRRKGAFVARPNGNSINRLRAATASHSSFKRTLFRQQCGQFGLGTGDTTLRDVAFGKICGATFLQRQQSLCRFLNRRLQGRYLLCGSVTNTFKFRFIAQRRQLIRQPRRVARRPVGPPLCIRHCRIRHAQLSFGARLFG